MRISQTLASQIAIKLTAKKREAEKEVKKEYVEYFTTIAEKKVPKDIMEFFKKHSEYVKTTNSMQIDGKGFNRLQINFNRAIPSVSPNCYYDHIDLTDAEAAKGKKLVNQHEKMKSDNDDLYREIETALINLRTFANIEKELPEAVEFLPEKGLTLIVDTTKLREKLK